MHLIDKLDGMLIETTSDWHLMHRYPLSQNIMENEEMDAVYFVLMFTEYLTVSDNISVWSVFLLAHKRT